MKKVLSQVFFDLEFAKAIAKEIEKRTGANNTEIITEKGYYTAHHRIVVK